MKKFEEPKKITTLGVVIFSFVSLLIGAAALVAIDALTVLLVLKTSLPESALKIGGVIGGGVGVILAAAILAAKSRMKGIYSSLIISAAVITIKIIGNSGMHLNGYLNLGGLLGILLTVIFSLFGGMIGSYFKSK